MSSEEVIKFMNAAICGKHVKLDSSLTNHIPIANLSLDNKILAQVKRRCDLHYDKPQMYQEKIQHLET